MSSTRTSRSFTVDQPDGTRKTVSIVSAVTPDDLIRVALKSYIFSKRTGIDYGEPFSREVRDMLVRSRTTQRG